MSTRRRLLPQSTEACRERAARTLRSLVCDPVDLIDHLGNQPSDTRRWPELLVDLFAVNEAHNRRQNMETKGGARCAGPLSARRRLPRRSDALSADRRARAAGAPRCADLPRSRGNNHLDLAAKYKLTQTRIYQIIAEQHALFVRERQGKLFNG